jgi:hypothetical protein
MLVPICLENTDGKKPEKRRSCKKTQEDEAKLTDEERTNELEALNETDDLEADNATVLDYIRETFFNEHMDDSWFRNRFSPLARKRTALQHLDESGHGGPPDFARFGGITRPVCSRRRGWDLRIKDRSTGPKRNEDCHPYVGLVLFHFGSPGQVNRNSSARIRETNQCGPLGTVVPIPTRSFASLADLSIPTTKISQLYRGCLVCVREAQR